MKRSLLIVLTALAFTAAAFVPAQAQEDDESFFAIAVKASTLGAGLEGVFKVNDNFDARIGGNWFDLDYDQDISDIDYDIDLNLESISAILDFYPGQQGFRVSVGAIYNNNEIELQNRDQSVTINGTTYNSGQFGVINGLVSYDDEVAPYLGIGWGRPFGKEGRWTFTIDIGAIYTGDADVSLSSSGPISADPTFRANLASQEDEVEDELADYPVYPVVAVGFTFKF
jgi:hypothetical protein